MERNGTKVTTINLGHEQMLLIENEAQTKIKVLYGGVWLTEEGLAQDQIVGTGATAVVHSRGRVLLEALQPSRLELARREAASTRISQFWSRRWARLRAAVSGLRVRLHLAPVRQPDCC